MKKPVLLSTLGAWLLACAVPLANANTADTVGKKIYETTCAACHADGVASAPKPGDAKAWAPLIEEGQDILTAHAWVGVRAMPAQGGAPDLTLDDFAQAVAWMASASGGNSPPVKRSCRRSRPPMILRTRMAWVGDLQNDNSTSRTAGKPPSANRAPGIDHGFRLATS